MGDIINRLDILYKEFHVSLTRNESRVDTKEYDYDGGAKISLSMDYRFLAVCEYILHNDKSKFLKILNQSASLILRMFEEFYAGKSIDHSYLHLSSYKNILDGAASGDLELARKLAKLVGERPEDKKQKGFFPYLSYRIRYLTLQDKKNLEICLEKCLKEREHKTAKNFRGYSTVVSGVFEKDEKKVNEGFLEILQGHKKLCRRGSEFSDSEDEVIFLHGLGLANLCLDQGFQLHFKDALIPEDLLFKNSTQIQ
ncbi:MAG: hypothetical protein SFU98_12205 [Leptospiraceae bacterium]|nr:hypothetical protein [Leptospiraceae bacterium]